MSENETIQPVMGEPTAPEPKPEKGRSKSSSGSTAFATSTSAAVSAAATNVASPPGQPLRSGYRSGSPGASAVAALARATGTSPMVLAALRAAYRWTDETRLTRAEFLKLRDAWLHRPAREV